MVDPLRRNGVGEGPEADREEAALVCPGAGATRRRLRECQNRWLRASAGRPWGSVAGMRSMRSPPALGLPIVERTPCRGGAERPRTCQRARNQAGSLASTGENVSSASTWQASPSGAGLVRTDASSSRPAPTEECGSPPSRPYAWARRNSDQLGPRRRGAGPSPDLRKTVAIVVAETLIPSFSSSPSIRM